jgi:hypothetical protein
VSISNLSPSTYLPAFRESTMDEEATEAERRAEMLYTATNRVTAKTLGVNAWTGSKNRRTEIRPEDLKRVKKQTLSSADRLVLIRTAALKAKQQRKPVTSEALLSRQGG